MLNRLSISKTLNLIMLLVLFTLVGTFFSSMYGVNLQLAENDKVSDLSQDLNGLFIIQTRLMEFQQAISANLSKDELESLKNKVEQLKKLDFATIFKAKRSSDAENIEKVASAYLETAVKILDERLLLGSQEAGFGKLHQLGLIGKEFKQKAGFFTTFINDFNQVSSSEKSFYLNSSEQNAKKWREKLKVLQDKIKILEFKELLPILQNYAKTQEEIITIQSQTAANIKSQKKTESAILANVSGKISGISKVLDEAKSGVKKKINSYLISLFVILFIVSGVIMAVTLLLSQNLKSKIRLILNRLTEIKNGNLSLNFSQDILVGSNEFSQLADGVQSVSEQLKHLISNIADNNNLIQTSAESLKNHLTNMSQDNSLMSAGSDNLVAATEQISAAAHEVSQASLDMERAAQEALEQSKSGGQIVVDSINSMKSILDLVEGMNKKAEDLEYRTQEIDKVMELISDIANQTNLLALNAAIEAARVGESGRGFAVVADEVRSLAEGTVNAAEEINSLINKLKQDAQEVIDKVNQTRQIASETSQLSNAALESISGIELKFNTTSQNITGVRNAMEEVAGTTIDMARQTDNLNLLVIKQKEYSDAILEINQSLVTQAELLENNIDKFKF